MQRQGMAQPLVAHTDPTLENTGRAKNKMELVLWTCGFRSQLCTAFACESS